VKEFKTRAMTIVLRSDNIVEMISNEEWDGIHTLEVAKENMIMVKKAIDGQPRGLLVRIPKEYTNRDAIAHYQKVEVGDIARGMVLNSFAAKVAGNLYLRLTRDKPNEMGRVIPAKLFTDGEAAVEWLLEEIKKQKS
jgi:hypothetical protein